MWPIILIMVIPSSDHIHTYIYIYIYMQYTEVCTVECSVSSHRNIIEATPLIFPNWGSA